MKQVAVNRFVGGMDNDSDLRDIQSPNYRYALNIRNGYGSDQGVITNCKGAVKVNLTLPAGGSFVIGTVEDKANKGIIYFVQNNLGNHRIYEYFPEDTNQGANGSIYELARGSVLGFNLSVWIQGRVVDGKYLYWTDGRVDANGNIQGNPPRKLNIKKALTNKQLSYKIIFDSQAGSNIQYSIQYFDTDGTSLGAPVVIATVAAPSTKKQVLAAVAAGLVGQPVQVVNNLLWLEVKHNTQGVRLSITSVEGNLLTVPLNHYPVVLTERLFDLYKWSPLQEPDVSFFSDGSVTVNRLERAQPQFCLRYHYDDGEKSAWSPFSIIPTRLIFSGGKYVLDATKNRITITLPDTELDNPTTLTILEKVEIGARFANDAPLKSIAVLERWDFGVNAGTGHTYYFFNDAIYSTVPSDDAGFTEDTQAIKPYDFVPRICTSIEVASQEDGSARLFLGGNLQDYNLVTPDCSVYPFTVATPYVPNHQKRWKEYGVYDVGMVYYDEKGRKSPVVPVLRDYSIANPGQLAGIALEINHQPPLWAKKYRLAVTRNKRQRRWVLVRDTDPSPYFSNVTVGYFRVPDDGSVPVATTFADATKTHFGIRIKATFALNDTSTVTLFNDETTNYYIPSAGDRIFSVSPGLFPDRPIAGHDVQGVYLIIFIKYETGDPDWSGTPVNYVIEFYTPSGTTDRIYYETPQTLDILNPGASNRFHAGQINNQSAGTPARAYVRGGEEYVLSTADTPYLYKDVQINAADFGWGNVIDSDFKENFYSQQVRFSQIYLPDATSNGLSSFRGIDYLFLNTDFGAVTSLARVADVLLGICRHKTQPMYIGKARVLDLTGNDQIGRTDTVINIAQETVHDYGTQNPESVVVEDGRVYAVDARVGVIWRYGQNGQQDITVAQAPFGAGNKKFFFDKLRLRQLHGYIAGFDRKHNLYHVMLPESAPGARDNQTFGFEEARGVWVGEYSFLPQAFGRVGQHFVSFFAGDLYLHEKGATPNLFYLAQDNSEITFVFNPEAQKVKMAWNIRQQGNKLWEMVSGTVQANFNLAEGQSTKIPSARWKAFEGHFYADVLRDMLDTSQAFSALSGTAKDVARLLRGRVLKIDAMEMKFKLVAPSVLSWLRQIDTEWSESNETR